MSIVVSHLRLVVVGAFTTNYDVGEMFLNFMLEPKLHPFAGVELTCLFLEDVSAENEFIRGCWERMLIGFYPFPYWVTKDLMEVKMMIRRNRRALGNLYVVFNLPGTFKYNPSMHWIYKVGIDDEVVSDLYFHVDDGRPTAGSAVASWRVTQRVCQLFCFLGIQDAYRKRTAPSQQSGE